MIVIKSRVKEETLATLIEGLASNGIISGNMSQVIRDSLEVLADYYISKGYANKYDSTSAEAFLTATGFNSRQLALNKNQALAKRASEIKDMLGD